MIVHPRTEVILALFFGRPDVPGSLSLAPPRKEEVQEIPGCSEFWMWRKMASLDRIYRWLLEEAIQLSMIND